MNVISFKKLRDFYEIHPDSKNHLTSWFKTMQKAEWKDFNALKANFPSTDLVEDNRIIFNVRGNRYRLIIKSLGTHADYDKINAGNV